MNFKVMIVGVSKIDHRVLYVGIVHFRQKSKGSGFRDMVKVRTYSPLVYEVNVVNFLLAYYLNP